MMYSCSQFKSSYMKATSDEFEYAIILHLKLQQLQKY